MIQVFDSIIIRQETEETNTQSVKSSDAILLKPGRRDTILRHGYAMNIPYQYQRMPFLADERLSYFRSLSKEDLTAI